MSRAQEYRWVAEVHNSLRTVIGDGLRQQLEAPRELPSELASLVAQIASPNASLRAFGLNGEPRGALAHTT